jgi:S1-C subfamily serine protease
MTTTAGLLYSATLLFSTGLRLAGQANFNSAEIAKRAAPAVVTIKVQTTDGEVVGSGFIVSGDGKIVTSLHVIRGVRRGSVQLQAGDIFDSFNVRAVDERRDLAIIQVAGFDLPTVELGNSNDIQPGEPVLLVGSPQGLQGTITAGVVSAIRDLPEGLKVIQTDASVNPGNSGGPLLNSRAQAIGVLGFRLRDSSGLNFAVPINYIRGMLNSIQSGASVPTVTMSAASDVMNPNPPQRLRDIKTLAIASLGASDGAGLVREKLMNRLAMSGRITVVDEADKADAVLTGVVGVDIYGRADTAAFRLTTKDGRILWAGEHSARGLGSYSSKMADNIANGLVKAIENDIKAK